MRSPLVRTVLLELELVELLAAIARGLERARRELELWQTELAR
jgi:hypothetical protein